jgi:hypothetical protein
MADEKTKRETIDAVKKLAEAKVKLLQGQTKDLTETAKRLNDIVSNPAITEAFKSVDNLKDIQSKLIGVDKYSDLAKLAVKLEKSLKPDYAYVAKAAEQLKSTQKMLGIPEDTFEEIKKSVDSLKNTYDPLKYAVNLSKQITALNQTALGNTIKEWENSQRKFRENITPKAKVKHTTPGISESSKFIIEQQQHMAEKAKRKEQREETLLENSEAQIEKLDQIVEYMVRQSKNLELQNEILAQQVENLILQNKKAEEQIHEIEKQNHLMREQQEENRKSSRNALWIAIISIIIGAVTTAFTYYLQDESDNKNHSELLQAINNTGSSNELLPLLKEQNRLSKKTNELLENSLKKNEQVGKNSSKQKEVK